MPPRPKGARVIALAAIILAAGCGTKSKPRVRLPSYAVGSSFNPFVDPSRDTPDNGSVPGHSGRDLPADIWYPAQADPTLPETANAPLDPRGEPYPLVVFVHGSEGLSRQSTFLTQGLARKGYVVIAGNYPLTYLFTPGGPSDQHCDLEVGDVSFLADQMFEFSKNKDSPLYGAMDTSAGFAVMGHSTGGAVSLAAAFGPKNHDSRIKAAVALAPDACFFTDSFFRTRSVPIEILAGTDDHYVPPGDNGVRAFQLAGAPKRLGLLFGGQHLGFTDFTVDDGTETPDSNTSDITVAFEAAEGGAADCDHQPPIGTDPLMPSATQRDLTVQLVTAFLDAWLYADSSGLKAVDESPPTDVTWQGAGSE
jgi:predicted dienelactone hydrolase